MEFKFDFAERSRLTQCNHATPHVENSGPGHRFSRRHVLLGSLAVALGASSDAQSQAGRIGVVLLHGKGSQPYSLGGVADAIKSAGMLTVSPELPWSGSRYLAGNWNQAMSEIGAAVAQARGMGAARIALLGHSMGCPAAMAYAAKYKGVAAVVLAAPGHSPAGYYNLTPEGKASVDRARAMVKAGQGNQVATFSDNNQGRSLQVETTAANYLSYFDPNGPCDMHRTAGSVGVPAMWIAGTNDQVVNWGADIGRRVTARPKSAYVVLPGATHVSTPSQASGQIVTWLQQV